jgi:predicted small secreted protein
MNVPVFLLRREQKKLKSGAITILFRQDIIDMKKTIVLLSLIMVTGLLAGCANTAQGAGRDIENMGEWIQQKV